MTPTGPGRPSAAAVALLPALPADRLKPPPELSGDPVATRIFAELVAAAPERHFTALDLPLLSLFCRMRSQAEAATLTIARDLPNASSALLQAQAQAVEACFDLSLRLRISPQARLSKVNSRKKPPLATMSAYDRLAMELPPAATTTKGKPHGDPWG